MAIRLRQLEAFRAVVQSGNITRAAETLNISQPAVSRLLKDFSAEVGFDLFHRRDGQLTPTQESRYLLGEVSRLLDSLGHIEELTKTLTARQAGHLRIACLPGFATSHLPHVVAQFLKQRAGVTVTIEPDRPERILEWIIGEQYDFGITDAFAGHPAVQSQPFDMRTVCILPKGHALADQPEITPEDLTDERMIHTRRDSTFYRELDATFTTRGLILPSLVEVRQFTAACMLVAEGVGVSVVSEMDAQEYAPHGLILKPYTPNITHRLTLVHPTHSPASLVTLEFIEAFKESLKPYLA